MHPNYLKIIPDSGTENALLFESEYNYQGRPSHFYGLPCRIWIIPRLVHSDENTFAHTI